LEGLFAPKGEVKLAAIDRKAAAGSKQSQPMLLTTRSSQHHCEECEPKGQQMKCKQKWATNGQEHQ
jgi:hypothetical protein